MSKRQRVVVGLIVALSSLWVGAVVITLLPEGTVALHLAAIASTLFGAVIGGMLTIGALSD